MTAKGHDAQEATKAIAVLVVDDSSLVRQKVAEALAGPRFELIEARDGVEALAHLGRRADIGLVVCDVNMPRVSGVQLAQFVARTPALASTPILMISSTGTGYDVERAKGLGVKAWVTKPFDASELLAIASRLTAANSTR